MRSNLHLLQDMRANRPRPDPRYPLHLPTTTPCRGLTGGCDTRMAPLVCKQAKELKLQFQWFILLAKQLEGCSSRVAGIASEVGDVADAG